MLIIAFYFFNVYIGIQTHIPTPVVHLCVKHLYRLYTHTHTHKIVVLSDTGGKNHTLAGLEILVLILKLVSPITQMKKEVCVSRE